MLWKSSSLIPYGTPSARSGVLVALVAVVAMLCCIQGVRAYTFPQLSPVPPEFDRSKCGIWKQFTLIFLHLQKCGGTSVEVSLRQFAWTCGIGYMRYPGPKKSWAAMLRSGKVNIVTGHNFYGIHKYLPPKRKYAYVTVLREPVPRLISHFHHRGPKDCRYNCSLYQYGRLTGNYYVRHLLTQSQPLKPSKDTRHHNPHNLALARANLNNFEVVGTLQGINAWFVAVQRLLRHRVGLDMELPPLGFSNVRDLQTVVATHSVNASDVKMEKKIPVKGEVNPDFQYPGKMLSQLRVMLKDDYELWRVAQALALKHSATEPTDDANHLL